jgi:capsule polysaccharide export protein KpsC/LpsZ
VSNERFLLFPLHYQPEASTLVLGYFYDDQLSVIENIAKALPIGTYLYVKEHRIGFGLRRNAYYRRIRSYPNVRLIGPYANTRRLVADCDGVVTISSTVGWEALCFGKPVFLMGETFYSNLPGVTKVSSYEALADALNAPPARSDQASVRRYVAALLEACHRGVYYIPHADTRVLSKQNISDLASAVVSAARWTPSSPAKLGELARA